MGEWEAIEAEYITADLGYRRLARKYGVSFTTLQRRALKENWVEKRQKYRDGTAAAVPLAGGGSGCDRLGGGARFALPSLDKPRYCPKVQHFHGVHQHNYKNSQRNGTVSLAFLLLFWGAFMRQPLSENAFSVCLLCHIR